MVLVAPARSMTRSIVITRTSGRTRDALSRFSGTSVSWQPHTPPVRFWKSAVAREPSSPPCPRARSSGSICRCTRCCERGDDAARPARWPAPRSFPFPRTRSTWWLAWAPPVLVAWRARGIRWVDRACVAGRPDSTRSQMRGAEWQRKRVGLHDVAVSTCPQTPSPRRGIGPPRSAVWKTPSCAPRAGPRHIRPRGRPGR